MLGWPNGAGSGPPGVMPPLAKGMPEFAGSPGHAAPPMPTIYNGPNLYGDPNPPPPPSLNQFMAARVPMMPPAYADVGLEARMNAIQAGARGDAMSEWSRTMADYNRLNFDRNTQAADWMLRRDLGMGGLGLQQRQLDLAGQNAEFDRRMREQGFGLERDRFAFERQRYEQGRSPVEQERAMAASLLGSGRTGPEVQAMLDDYRHMFPQATSAAPPMPGDSPPGNAKGSGEPFTPGWSPSAGSTGTPRSRGNIYDPFVRDFDQIVGEPVTDSSGKKTQAMKIGEFLNKLDTSKQPGFVQQNWPAIQAYIKSKWGEGEFNKALAPPITMDAYDIAGFLPLMGPLSRWAGGQMGLSRQVPLFGQDSTPAYTWAGGIAPVYKAILSSETAFPGTQPSEDAFGRAKLRDLMRLREGR